MNTDRVRRFCADCLKDTTHEPNHTCRRQREANRKVERMVGGYNVECSRCNRAFSSGQDYHTHVIQGCK